MDHSYAYDQVGRLTFAYTGAEARAHVGNGSWGNPDGPYALGYEYDSFGNMTRRYGWGGWNYAYTASYVNNRRVGDQYDAAGNLSSSGGQSFTYDATNQQAMAYTYSLSQFYDGDRLRVKKVESGQPTYYLRSSVLGGQVICEINGRGEWTKGYVYLGSQLLAIQQQGTVQWVHQEPVTKAQRITNTSGQVISTIEFDPFGGETNRSSNSALQTHKYTSYERNIDGNDYAMARQYHGFWSRFDQPDPFDGSYDLTNPQSLNRYSYVQNDPVNFVDPSGLANEKGEEDCAHNPGGVCNVAGNDTPHHLWADWAWDWFFGSWGGGGGYGIIQPIGGGGGGGGGGGTGGDPGLGGDAPQTGQQPDPAEIERLINSCLQNISVIPKNYFNAIRDNKRDAQSLMLSLAHAATESSFLPSIVEGPLTGRQGEIGLFQIKPSTANGLGLGKFTRSQLYNLAVNTQLATTYLQNLINSFNGDVRTALGAYKQGPRSVRENGLTKKSQEYADAILGCERAIFQGRR